ncbi:hypothetical protein D3C85_1587960 [compost metagenome]
MCLLQGCGCTLLLAEQFVMARQPLKILRTVLLFAEQGFLFVSKYLQTLLQLLLLLFA